ncbi:hypothetical protein MKFW12EY_17810 [Methylomonas koyamae]|nr:hypothetical protein MKFW12EY_17810 [Methylomonas koyamae]
MRPNHSSGMAGIIKNIPAIIIGIIRCLRLLFEINIKVNAIIVKRAPRDQEDNEAA